MECMIFLSELKEKLNAKQWGYGDIYQSARIWRQLSVAAVSGQFQQKHAEGLQIYLGRTGKGQDWTHSPGTGKTCRSTDCHKATEFLKIRLGLEVHTNKTTIYDANHGVSFLGAYLKPHRCYIHTKTLSRLLNCLKKVIKEEKPVVICNSINSYLGTLSHYYSYRLRYNIMKSHPELFRYGYFGKSILKYRLRHTYN